jgi:hypothetical protein
MQQAGDGEAQGNITAREWGFGMGGRGATEVNKIKDAQQKCSSFYECPLSISIYNIKRNY